MLERHNRQTKAYSKSGSGGSETFVAPFSLKFKNLDSNVSAVVTRHSSRAQQHTDPAHRALAVLAVTVAAT